MKEDVARAVFIAGTDTGVGKTVVAAALVRALVREGLLVAAMKPVAAGAELTPCGLRNADALSLIEAANVTAAYEHVNPYCFAPPIAPHIAAHEAGSLIDTALLRECFQELADLSDCVVVEGAGGWLTPIGPGQTMADVAAALCLPVVLVVGLKLGCLNHAALTARALGSHGAGLAGWIGNSITPDFDRKTANIAALEKILKEPAATIVSYASQRPEALELPPAAAKHLVALR
jgi:dethiobiotin synthetase